MILLSGANGNLGGAIINNLLNIIPDKTQIAVGTRNPKSEFAQRLGAAGLAVRFMDFNDPDSLAATMKGVRKALIISTWDTNAVRIRQHRNAIDAAVGAGVQHLIYTSFINASPEAVFEHGSRVHAPTEQMIRASGLTYTFLRHNLYAEFLVADLKETLARGELRRGGGDAKFSLIGRDDLGESAAWVLAMDGHENRVYNETGPEALTMAQSAAIMSDVFGRPVVHVDLSPEAWYEQALAMGYEESMARASTSTVRAALQGEFSDVSPDYAAITGHPARTLRRLLQDNRDKYLQMFGS
jgi:NAD(P)H dehydrogenase (quinone)